MKAKNSKRSLAELFPQRCNANKHTQRGLGMLDAALSEDGYVAPMTAAADGEIIDGSARLERVAERFAGVEPLVIEHDGKRPVIMVRKDIPSADTEQAVRIALRANRIAQVDLEWSAEELAKIAEAWPDATKGLWSADELAEAMGEAENTSGREVSPDESVTEQYLVVVTCGSESDQLALIEQQLQEGRQCRALIS